MIKNMFAKSLSALYNIAKAIKIRKKELKEEKEGYQNQISDLNEQVSNLNEQINELNNQENPLDTIPFKFLCPDYGNALIDGIIESYHVSSSIYDVNGSNILEMSVLKENTDIQIPAGGNQLNVAIDYKFYKIDRIISHDNYSSIIIPAVQQNSGTQLINGAATIFLSANSSKFANVKSYFKEGFKFVDNL